MIIQIFEAQTQEKFMFIVPPDDSKTDGMLCGFFCKEFESERPRLGVGKRLSGSSGLADASCCVQNG